MKLEKSRKYKRIRITNKKIERLPFGIGDRISNRQSWYMRISIIPNIVLWASGNNRHIPDDLINFKDENNMNTYIDNYKYNYGLNIDWLYWNIHIDLF